jgi:uncharacterized protein YndB with AHSA1/START domain
VSPGEAWEAIATGPGITAWFMPAEVDGRVGGTAVHTHDGETRSAATITGYDPPRRFAYEERDVMGEGDLIATEFLVEARSGGRCVVRVVMSGFGDGEEWDRAIESFEAGWRQVLASLRLYLTHFAGRRAESIVAAAQVSGDEASVWTELCAGLGLPELPRPGDRVATQADGAPALAGTVDTAGDHQVTLLLDEPARGIGLLGAGGPGEDEVFVTVRAQLFGDDAAEVAERDQARWTAWFAAHTGGASRGAAAAASHRPTR